MTTQSLTTNQPSTQPPGGAIRIAVDRREKLPYLFNQYPGATTILKTLRTGDYSIAGHEDYIAVERKSLDDFLGSITHGRKRFFRELDRLSLIPYRCIVIEDMWCAVVDGLWERQVSIESVSGTIQCILQDFLIPVYFLGDRYMAQEFTYRFLEYRWRRMNDEVPVSRKWFRQAKRREERPVAGPDQEITS